MANDSFLGLLLGLAVVQQPSPGLNKPVCMLRISSKFFSAVATNQTVEDQSHYLAAFGHLVPQC